jgi:hypothetical protein
MPSLSNASKQTKDASLACGRSLANINTGTLPMVSRLGTDTSRTQASSSRVAQESTVARQMCEVEVTNMVRAFVLRSTGIRVEPHCGVMGRSFP